MAAVTLTWTDLLNELNRDAAREQPQDVIQWGADWFQSRLKRDRVTTNGGGKRAAPGSLGPFSQGGGDVPPHALSPFSETGPADSPLGAGVGGARRATIASGSTLFTVPFGGPATGSSAPPREASPFGGDNVQFNASPFGQPPTGDDVAHEEPQIPSYALGRRTSVSAESLVPANHRSLPPTGALESTLEEDESTPNPSATPMPVFPKSPEQLARIRAAIKPNFLFANLDEEQEADQGAAGDYFYVVESGKLDVFVKKEGQVFDEAKGDNPKLGKKVATCIEGSSFGELALMHNAPRAASIISITPCTLWALDRVSFRTILLDHTSRKRRLYETFLSEVPILTSLQPQERAKIADVLESRTFAPGQDVIKEGDAGEEFFLIESGNAVAIKKDASGNEAVVKQLTKGDYFGELALINRQTRAATVRAAGPEKLRVAALGEQAFTRLLGPVKDIMARSVGERYGFAALR
ncbi:hypothetical protein EHS25_004350 [Saitozyma podzolica]|uniref:cAMP-dependent protein kinase regulatory subunit n=1 Tax=Saitozyma podzolica TaxID=1890683 RepID=A0A427YU29_9TREE|nr:hypothetical protein EHS25_004350 [Saitozyma podzolica]